MVRTRREGGRKGAEETAAEGEGRKRRRGKPNADKHKDATNALRTNGKGGGEAERLDTFELHMQERDFGKGADEEKSGGRLVSVKLTCVGASGKAQVRVLSDKPGTVGASSSEGSRVVYSELGEHSIKERLIRHWGTLQSKGGADQGDNGGERPPSFCSADQAALFTALHQYKDVLHLRREAPDVSQKSPKDEVLDAVLLHCINHVMKTSDLVKKGNSVRDKAAKRAKTSAGQEKDGKGTPAGAKEDAEEGEPQRDQGFTRPKVLILLPFRKFAFNFIHRMMKLVMLPNFSRKHFRSISGGVQFLDEYSGGDQDDDESSLPEKVRKGLNKPMQNKPKDFRNLFQGNSDDHFRMGVKLTKSSVKLYSDFYKSDIIVASPLGLVTLMNDAERSSEQSFEFLSSIEVLVVDYADVLMMQNWEHVLSIVSNMNKIPSSNHNTDIMRIREWCLAGNAKRYLQTVALSSYATAELNSFMNACSNFEGMVKFPSKTDPQGVVSTIINPMKQLFIKNSDPGNIEDESETKMDHFEREVLNKVLESFSPGVMIFVRSYFDFVRMRRKLDEQNANFVALSEYTERAEADRYRTFFANGSKRILLYSERAHFYFRYRFKGIRDIVFYSLPDHSHFYSELLNMIDSSSVQQPTATVAFSKYDSLQLSRTVGLSQAKSMLSSDTETFLMA
ncbi:hypothetical protein A3770_05p35550 [Chloropicon primus]|uniref:U3 small nucleolar RNA-associated protein 25 n=3 Tax=Chloropicon primus TaxID=1764295 RepID=A0A5B8MKQ1_9CHLO|nr:hypothetical protein A3770_05p35550 [Chloropicon primus]|eukprot:QDZ21037.1 hypothetical protein A3770_05p35550 [Chloropicon primus]